MNRSVLCLASMLTGACAAVGAVSISFLNSGNALEQTATLLRAQGCTPDAVARFTKTAERYNGASLPVNLSKFPRSEKGFYTFNSASKLVAALPGRLRDTEHDFDLNCFDFVILLMEDLVHIRIQPDEDAGPFLVPSVVTTNEMVTRLAATARDAFLVGYPSWYIASTSEIMPPTRNDERVCLTAALFSFYALPLSGTESQLSESVRNALRTKWRSRGLNFPSRIEVVLCHSVDFPRRRMVTEHAGLLFRSGKKFIYLEKAGGSGPFVRIDLDTRAELKIWLSNNFRDADPEYSYVFATYNDTAIEMLDLVRAPAKAKPEAMRP